MWFTLINSNWKFYYKTIIASPCSAALVLCDTTSDSLSIASYMYPFFFFADSNDVICFVRAPL